MSVSRVSCEQPSSDINVSELFAMLTCVLCILFSHSSCRICLLHICIVCFMRLYDALGSISALIEMSCKSYS